MYTCAHCSLSTGWGKTRQWDKQATPGFTHCHHISLCVTSTLTKHIPFPALRLCCLICTGWIHHPHHSEMAFGTQQEIHHGQCGQLQNKRWLCWSWAKLFPLLSSLCFWIDLLYLSRKFTGFKKKMEVMHNWKFTCKASVKASFFFYIWIRPLLFSTHCLQCLPSKAILLQMANRLRLLLLQNARESLQICLASQSISILIVYFTFSLPFYPGIK